MNTNNEHTSWKHKKIFDSISPFTLLDFSKYPSAILWLNGCNMRCDYCYNPELVFGKGKLDFYDIEKFLESRKGLLQGVVICGGEPTIHKELINIISEIKSMGFKVKLDTNGSHPEIVLKLLEMVDFVALDFKAPKEKFQEITQTKEYEKFYQTLKLLIDAKIDFETRTTYHSELLTHKDIDKIVKILDRLHYDKVYVIQNFLNEKNYINQNIPRSNSIRDEDIKEYQQRYSFPIMIR